MQRHVTQGGPIGGGILKGDVLQSYVAARAAQLDPTAILLGLLIEQAEYTLGSRQTTLNMLADTGQTLERCKHEQHGRYEGNEATYSRAIGLHVERHAIDHHTYRDGGEQLNDRHIGSGRTLLLHQQAAHEVDCTFETRLLVGLTAEDLHDLLALDAFLQDLRDFSHRRLGPSGERAQAAVEQTHGERDGRNGEKRDQSELPVEPQQVAQQTDHRDGIAHQYGHDVGDRIGDLVDVERELRHQAAAHHLAIEGLRQDQQLGEHAVTQVHHHALPDVSAAVAAHERAQPPYDEDEDDQERNPAHQDRVARDERSIQKRLCCRRQGDLGRGRQDHPQDGQREYAPIGAYAGQQSAVQLRRCHRREIPRQRVPAKLELNRVMKVERNRLEPCPRPAV